MNALKRSTIKISKRLSVMKIRQMTQRLFASTIVKQKRLYKPLSAKMFCSKVTNGETANVTEYAKVDEFVPDTKSIDFLLSVDDKNYSKILKTFCHYYQIPFIENNVQKTTYDAAKIFYKLEEDSIKIPEKFNWLVGLLSSIPKSEVEDTDTTYKMKDKWMKFFRSGIQRIQIDQDKAMTNKYNEIMHAYIQDTYQEMTDLNLVRAYDMIDEYTNHKNIRLLDKVFHHLHNQIKGDRFNLDSDKALFSLCYAYLK